MALIIVAGKNLVKSPVLPLKCQCFLLAARTFIALGGSTACGSLLESVEG